jgi:hypothetical protein
MTGRQAVAANRNLERDFFQKVNAFFQKVNAFFEKVNAFFQKDSSASRRVSLATKGTQEHQIFNWSAPTVNSGLLAMNSFDLVDRKS